MKYLALIFLFSISALAQNVWYVNKEATGANTGRNWTDAWTYFDSSSNNSGGINWRVISAGDTIYVSGGEDSTRYYPQIQPYPYYGMMMGHASGGVTFASGDPVVLTPSWESGHNGDVWFTTQGYGVPALWIGEISNVKLVNFTFHTDAQAQALSIGGDSGTDSMITIYGCHIIADRYFGGVGLSTTRATIDSCIIETTENNSPYDQDLLTGSGSGGQGKGAHTITNNKIITRVGYESTSGNGTGMTTTDTSLTDTDLSMTTNYHVSRCVYVDTVYMYITSNTGNTFYGSGGWFYYDGEGNEDSTNKPTNGSTWAVGCESHRDMIQISFQGAGEGDYRVGTIANNLIMDTREEGTSWNGLLYLLGYNNFRWNIYNNVIVCRKNNTAIAGVWFSGYYVSEFIKSGLFINNTLIMKGNSPTPITFNIDSVTLKNNLVIVDTSTAKIYNVSSTTVKDIDYNIYARQDYFGDQIFAYNGPTYTYDTWQGLGYDAHSDTVVSTAVTFTNKYGEDLEDYYTTTGRDLGDNLWDEYPFLRTDILGNPRPQSGNWDIGALEYQGSSPVNNAILKGSAGKVIFDSNGKVIRTK